MDEDLRIQMRQYKHLRAWYRKTLQYIFGERYYNLGNDVYACDEIAARDIMTEVDILRREKKLYLNLFCILLVLDLMVMGAKLIKLYF